MTKAENIIEVSDATFERDVVERSQTKPVVVDFWAPWCGPCRMLGPVLERLAADPALDFVLAKVNADENPALSRRYRVQSIPAVKAFVDGQVAAEFVGAQPEPRVRQFIERLIPNDTDQALREAQSRLATHHWAEAETILADLLDKQPAHKDAHYHMARALLAQGRGCAALSHLEKSMNSPHLLSAERLLTLAHYLCRAETAATDNSHRPSPEAQYNQAAHLIRRGNLSAAMYGLLEVLRQDKGYRNGEPKHVLLAIFELLGNNDSLTQTYRSEMAMVLF